MNFVNKAERYIEVKNLLESYSECLENENSDFGQKKSVQLLEAIFNNQIIGLRLVFELLTLELIQSESREMEFQLNGIPMN